MKPTKEIVVGSNPIPAPMRMANKSKARYDRLPRRSFHWHSTLRLLWCIVRKRSIPLHLHVALISWVPVEDEWPGDQRGRI